MVEQRHHVILVDPHAKAPFRPVTWDGGLETLYTLLSGPDGLVSAVDAVALTADGDTLYVDDEGLFKAPTGWILFRDAGQPFAGLGLIAGTDAAGGPRDPARVTLDWCRAHLKTATTAPGVLPEPG